MLPGRLRCSPGCQSSELEPLRFDEPELRSLLLLLSEPESESLSLFFDPDPPLLFFDELEPESESFFRELELLSRSFESESLSLFLESLSRFFDPESDSLLRFRDEPESDRSLLLGDEPESESLSELSEDEDLRSSLSLSSVAIPGTSREFARESVFSCPGPSSLVGRRTSPLPRGRARPVEATPARVCLGRGTALIRRGIAPSARQRHSPPSKVRAHVSAARRGARTAARDGRVPRDCRGHVLDVADTRGGVRPGQPTSRGIF